MGDIKSISVNNFRVQPLYTHITIIFTTVVAEKCEETEKLLRNIAVILRRRPQAGEKTGYISHARLPVVVLFIVLSKANGIVHLTVLN